MKIYRKEENIIFQYDERYDVIIMGGGVSGAMAAIASGRSGARVLLLEQGGYLGGALTRCGVGPMMTFHAGEKQVVKGLMQELVDNLVKRGYSSGHVKDTTGYISYLTPFSTEGLKLVLDEMVQKEKCVVMYHTFLGDVKVNGTKISAITICNKDGIHQISAKVFVDATGDGDMAAWAGANMTKGRETDHVMQPMTMNMKYSNVDSDALKQYLKKHIKEFERLQPNEYLIQTASPLCVTGFRKEFEAAKESKEITFSREDLLFFETSCPNEYIINTTRIQEHDPTDALSLSDAERVGRQQCAELDCFLRKVVPGFAKANLEYTGPSVGVRESRQLVGDYVLTAEDIISGKPFDSVIAHASYPIDIHSSQPGGGTDTTFLSNKDAYYSIPYEVMTSPQFQNMLVVGRCVSTTFEAQAAIRVTPIVGAIGHAGGIAAAIAALQGQDVHKVSRKQLQQMLLAQGAYLEV